MKVLTVANRKGGAGKSTCAAHIAVEAVKDGIKTILIDLDPQKTLESWWNKRESDDLPLIDVDIKDLNEVLDGLNRQGFELCIIDTPGDTSQNAKVGASVAHLVLIPSKPTAPDLSATGRTISIVEEYGKKFVFVLTQGVSRSKAIFQASVALSSFGAVAPGIISNRISYASAMGEGLSAGDRDKLAQEEMSGLWNFLSERLFETKKQSKQKLTAYVNFVAKEKFALTEELIEVKTELDSQAGPSRTEIQQNPEKLRSNSIKPRDRITVCLPSELKKDLKIYSVERGKNMGEMVMDALKIYITKLKS